MVLILACSRSTQNTVLALITMKYFVMWTKIDFPVNFLTPIADLSENTQTYYKICSLLLPICTIATAVKAVCRYCCRVSGCDSHPHFCFLIMHVNLLSLIYCILLKTLCLLWYWQGKQPHP